MDELSEALRELRRDSSTYVYAIQAGEDGPVKIGTARDPRERLLTLQTGNPVRLRGLAAWRGCVAEEKIWHETFKDLRLEGEWFQPAAELLELVDFLGGPPNGCEFHREGDCLAAGPSRPLVGTCEACGMQCFDGEELE